MKNIYDYSGEVSNLLVDLLLENERYRQLVEEKKLPEANIVVMGINSLVRELRETDKAAFDEVFDEGFVHSDMVYKLDGSLLLTKKPKSVYDEIKARENSDAVR